MTLIKYLPEEDVTYCGYYNQAGVFIKEKGYTFTTHTANKCVGETCCIHNPSDHPLRDAALNWRFDRYLMERVCIHGVGHPDPDDLAFKRRSMDPGAYRGYAFESHGCDGCCWGGRY